MRIQKSHFLRQNSKIQHQIVFWQTYGLYELKAIRNKTRSTKISFTLSTAENHIAPFIV